jgi:hypothetical protein
VGRPPGQANVFQVLGTPINPARVEIQSNWQEDALYPPSVCTLEVNVPVQIIPPVARAEPPCYDCAWLRLTALSTVTHNL